MAINPASAAPTATTAGATLVASQRQHMGRLRPAVPHAVWQEKATVVTTSVDPTKPAAGPTVHGGLMYRV